MKDEKQILQTDTAEDLLKQWSRISRDMALGIVFLMWGIAFYMIAEAWLNQGRFPKELQDFMAFILLTLFAALGAGLLLFSHMSCQEQKRVSLSDDMTAGLRQEWEQYKKKYHRLIVTGIIGLVLSPALYFLGEVIWGKASHLPAAWWILYLSVFLGILLYARRVRNSVMAFLTEEKPADTKRKRMEDLANSFVFVFAAAVYLVWSFLWKAWEISWIVFIVSGFVCFLIHKTCLVIYEKEEQQ